MTDDDNCPSLPISICGPLQRPVDLTLQNKPCHLPSALPHCLPPFLSLFDSTLNTAPHVEPGLVGPVFAYCKC